MSVDVQQLQSDFARVKKILALYPGSITLLQTRGDPPESYDIEYNVKGYRANPDGTASPADRHLIRISLPFGYPHSAPIVKPLTPVFHPDMDPDAVRIADFWEKHQSLPELIVHIGQMICGARCSTREPLNQRAFDWYEEHKSLLPFAELAPRKNETDDDGAWPGGGATASGDNRFTGIDRAGKQTPGDAETGPKSPVELPGDDFPFALELESKGGAGAGQGLEDWTAIQESGDFPFEDEGSGNTVRTGAFPEEPPAEMEDIFDIAFEPSADEAAPPGSDMPGEGGATDLNGPAGFREGSGSSGRSGADDRLEPEEEIIALDLDSDESLRPAGSGRAGRQKKAGTEDRLGLEGLSLELDEDPSRRYGGPARSIAPLIEQKEIFTAKKVLAELEEPETVADLEEYRQTIADAISRADELYKKADQHKQNGELEKAGIMLDLVANIAIDYPGLEFARNRIRESLMALGQKKPPPPPAEKKEPAAEGKDRKTTEETAPVRKPRRQTRVKLPLKLIAAVLVAAVCFVGGALLFKNDSENIRLAQQEFENGRRLIQDKDFQPARQALDSARSALDNILLLHPSAKHDLRTEIDTILNSPAYKEGLRGRVLYDGRYISIETARAIDQFKLLTEAAETSRQEGQLDRAVESYEQSLVHLEPAGLQEREQEIRQTITALRLQQSLNLAAEAEKSGAWEQAAAAYRQALELPGAFPSLENREQVELQLATVSFRRELDAGKRAYNASDWQESMTALERAQHILSAQPTIAESREAAELAKMLINSRLFHQLAIARTAFELQQWDRAVTEYAKAVALIDENAAMLGNEEAADSKRKIERTTLMTRIAGEQQRLDNTLELGDLEVAVAQYRVIARLIEESPFRDDEILGKTLEHTRHRTNDLEKELLINRRIDWLTQNAERIFREHYPSAKLSELSNPNVSFIRREGNIMIFAMSCTERRQGRVFRLELNYRYDLDTDTWNIYSGKL
ncbi:MAG TPA: hypothetical protein ENN06_05390 [Desulfobacteraceae bacterium]|nr:hypothetical protein [Desulfobacteraceae bacterium]